MKFTFPAEARGFARLKVTGPCSASYSMENNGDINTMRWGGDPKEGGPGIWLSNTFWGRLQPYIFDDIAADNQKMLGKEINRRLDGLFNSPDADSMAGTFISNARIYHDTSGLPVPIAFKTKLHKWGSFLKTSSFDDPSRILYTTYGSGFFSEADGKSYVPALRVVEPNGLRIALAADPAEQGEVDDGVIDPQRSAMAQRKRRRWSLPRPGVGCTDSAALAASARKRAGAATSSGFRATPCFRTGKSIAWLSTSRLCRFA